MVPAAVIMPNMTQKMPPMIGSGIETNRDPNLETAPKKRRIPAVY